MTQMMTTSVKLPPIIGPIMIPIFVDLWWDIGDSKNRFPGVYLQVFTNTQLPNLVNQNHSFLDNENNGYKFISFKRNYFHKHEKCLCKVGFGSLVFTYKKVQVTLLGMKYGGIGPLKLLYCINLFHIEESPMSQLVWSFSTLLDFFIQM
jgi:hypothetical protein